MLLQVLFQKQVDYIEKMEHYAEYELVFLIGFTIFFIVTRFYNVNII